MDRLPALPLIANDPYFSIWMRGDTLTSACTTHWTGANKPLTGTIKIDGAIYRFLGHDANETMQTTSLKVTPTSTVSTLEKSGVALTVRFCTPLLPNDLDMISTPITYVDLSVLSTDGKTHDVEVIFSASSALCYDGKIMPEMTQDTFTTEQLHVAFVGQSMQKVLCHSGDDITIDWGYLYMASLQNVKGDMHGLSYSWKIECQEKAQNSMLMLAYDDVSAINYFGKHCVSYYQREGKTLVDQLCDYQNRYLEIQKACDDLDDQILSEARAMGGEDYALIVSASYRQAFCGHKLIATPKGELAFLSKENDSNGCIGTVDVSYPSIPLFLKYCPELVNALCRPVLEFASLPVWQEAFAPHDVGRYPHATGQVYAAKWLKNGEVHPPYYLYPKTKKVYDIKHQMPVEECGNMIVMLYAAIHFGASKELAKKYLPTLKKWISYLLKYGEDPQNQLCTDDFAGHLARNVNLSIKAVMGIMCYAQLLMLLGKQKEGEKYSKIAQDMATSVYERAKLEGHTALTFDQKGWSMKYNAVWDLVFDFNLFDKAFYQGEVAQYLKQMNAFGLPLDSRKAYTKSDWAVWVSTMAQDKKTFETLIAPLAKFLRQSPSRVPFSDWYDTNTGEYIHFIARTVQGGVFMPMLKKWEKE